MFLNTLDRKPIIRNVNGELVRDLTKSIFDFTTGTKLNMSVYRVPTGFEMRPDLISQSVYNNTVYAEFVLKYNGISNPFSIDEGDIILIPSLESAKKTLKGAEDLSEESAATQIRNSYKYIDPTKIPERDGAISDFESRNLSTTQDKISEGSLPPNIAQEGESGITYRNGRVFFGEGISQSACLKNGMSSGEFLTKVIKTKS